MAEENKQNTIKKLWTITEGKNPMQVQMDESPDGPVFAYKQGKKFIYIPKEQVFEATENEIYDWEVKNKSAIGLYNKSENVVGRTLEDLAEGFVAPASSIVSDFIPADGLLGISKQTLQNAGRGIDAAMILSPFLKFGAGVGYNMARPVIKKAAALGDKMESSIRPWVGNPKKLDYIDRAVARENSNTALATGNEIKKGTLKKYDELLDTDLRTLTTENQVDDFVRRFDGNRFARKFNNEMVAGLEFDAKMTAAKANAPLRAAAAQANAKAKAIGTLEGIARYASSKRDATAVINAGFGLLDKDPKWLETPYEED